MFAVNMTASWDWKTNISEIVINKTADPRTGNPPPIVESAALYLGPQNDSQVYLYGGVTSTINQSFPNMQLPTTTQYTLYVQLFEGLDFLLRISLIESRWGFDTGSHVWTQHDIFDSVSERPCRGAYAEAQDQGLAFYLNGMLTNKSSYTTSYLGNSSIFLEGMIVLDLNSQTVPPYLK
jgi:hypothetical protein